MKSSFIPNENISPAELHAKKVVQAVKVILLTIIAMLLIVLKGSCSDSTHIKAKNAVYIQFAGKGNYKSINFEKVLRQGHTFNYSYSIGFSPASKSLSIPVSINAFTTGSRHHFEMSVAVIPYVEKHYYAKRKTDLDKQMYIKPSVGYRYQKENSGLFVKAAVGPQIFMDPPSHNVWAFTPKLIGPSAQIAVGISF